MSTARKNPRISRRYGESGRMSHRDSTRMSHRDDGTAARYCTRTSTVQVRYGHTKGVAAVSHDEYSTSTVATTVQVPLFLNFSSLLKLSFFI